MLGQTNNAYLSSDPSNQEHQTWPNKDKVFWRVGVIV